MATPIRPPPFLGPLEGVPVNGQYPDWVNLYLLRWDDRGQNWVTLGWGQHPWDSFPAGYYATAHMDADGNVDWGPHSTVIVVAGRSRPDGSAAPFVLEQPPAGAAPDSRCPPNMWFTDLPDQFNVIPGAQLCSWLPPQTQINCPEGTVWDPATETCKALPIILPPPIFPPTTPPEPVSESGQPDPDGDTLTFELCLQLQAGFDRVVAAVKAIGGSPGAGDSALDALLINALTTLNATLDSFQKFLAGLVAPSGNANPDPVTCAQLSGLFDTLTKAIADGDAAIADALAKAPAPAEDPNVKRIADAQNGFPSDAAGVEAKLDALLQLGVDTYGFPADFAQILKA